MKWSPVIGLILIIVLLTAVFASTESFTVAVSGPNVYQVSVIVPTPTPRLMNLHEVVELTIPSTSNQENIKIELPIPSDVSLPLAGVLDAQFLNRFHLCAGDEPCYGGVLAKTKHFYDNNDDGLADVIVLRFDAGEFQSIWPALPVSTPGADGVSGPIESGTKPFSISGTYYGWRTAQE